jgi:threonine/homoserine/homoserine lactone efflux protein
MPDPGRLAAFGLLSFVIIVVPGPSVLFVISRGVVLGRRAALMTVLGNETGLLVQVAAVAFGLGTIVERSITIFTVVKLAGAAYLVYLGVEAIRHRRALHRALEAEVVGRRARRIFRDGFVVGATNPKSVILFAAILPQFVILSHGHVTLQLLVLGLTSVVIALVCDSIWGVLAGTVRSWLGRSPRRLSVIGGVGGLVMVGLGLRLALTGRRD